MMINRKRQRGNVALAGTLMLVPLSLMAGIAIDFGRVWVAQDQLSQAVDAAALAAARQLGARDPTAEARQYFNANIGTRADLQVDQFSVVPAADNRTVMINATGRITTSFLSLAGSQWRSLPVRASARARRTTMGMEMALVLDVTGSMAGTAIAQLRLASADLITILFGNRASLDTLYVSVVPYTTTVNFGPTRTDWLQGGASAVAGFAPFRWRGCVEARDGGEDQTDTPPAQAPFRPFLYASTRAQTAAQAFGWSTRFNGPVYGDADWGVSPAITSTETADPDEQDTMDPAQMYTMANNRKGPNVGCGQPVAGLTNDRAALLNIVSRLQPSSRGGTMGNIGLQAGWMTISPRWRGLWGTSAWGTTTPPGMPLNYPGPRDFMVKTIVMMTDGNNAWFDYGRPPTSDYTGYGRVGDGRLGTTNTGTAVTRVDQRLAALCTNIKAQGIIIYTITLGTTPATQALYRACATSPAYYFHAPTPAQLRGAFQEIGSQLSNLRLEQ
jgi:Flp pilus assembly protein TadG